jgi:pimeloyl-ACP methyl ester carboxylesterase
MVGDLDERSTQLSCRHLADVAAGARFEVFHGAAHMLTLEQPEKFNSLVLDFLSSVDAAAGR